jgi:hypothetical protein
MGEYTESEILIALNKIDHVHQGSQYDHKFTFERFIKSETVLFILEYDSNSDNAIKTDVLSGIANMMNSNKGLLNVPEFNSLKDLNTWLSNKN